MRGTPVWLASLSRPSRNHGGRLPTQLWSSDTVAESARLLRRVIGPAGDPDRERLFRMNVTLCLHRACTDAELASAPDWFRQAEPIDLAGGPIAVLWESESGAPSTRPCDRPTQIPLDPRHPLLWYPQDCGSCPSCRARLVAREA